MNDLVYKINEYKLLAVKEGFMVRYHNRETFIRWEEFFKIDSKIEAMKSITNCKYGKHGCCNYPNAKYKNCYTHCNQWQLDEKLYNKSVGNITLIEEKIKE